MIQIMYVTAVAVGAQVVVLALGTTKPNPSYSCLTAVTDNIMMFDACEFVINELTRFALKWMTITHQFVRYQ